MMKIRWTWVVSALFLVAAPLLAAQTSHHYLCRFSLSDAGMTLASAIKVEGTLPASRFQTNRVEDFRFRLLDPKGEALFEGQFRDPRRVRAEFRNPDGTQEHANGEKPEGTLLIRLPEFPDGSLLKVERRVSQIKLGQPEFEFVPFADVPLTLTRP